MVCLKLGGIVGENTINSEYVMNIRKRTLNTPLLTALVTSLAISAAPSAVAEIKPGSASIVLGVDNLNIDDDRNLDSGIALHLLFGYSFSQSWGVEAGVRKGSFDSSTGMGDSDATVAHIDALYHFNGDGSWVPFLSTGVGSTSYNNGSLNQRSEFLSVGAGLKWYITENFMWRSDIRAQVHVNASTTDWSLGTGLGYQFGGTGVVEATLDTTDSDKDGIGDAEDFCPNTPTGKTVDQRGCPATAANDRSNVAIPVAAAPTPTTAPTTAPVATPAARPATTTTSSRYADDDNDGIPNAADDCLGTPEGRAVTLRGCIKDDADGDGVADAKDRCGRSAPGTKVDASGCAVKASNTAVPVVARPTPAPAVVTPRVAAPAITTPRVAAPAIPRPRAAAPAAATPIKRTVRTVTPPRIPVATAALDDDRDGVMNHKDRCPRTKAGVKVDLLGCRRAVVRSAASATPATDGGYPIAQTEPVPAGWVAPPNSQIIQSSSAPESNYTRRTYNQPQRSAPVNTGAKANLIERKIFNGKHFKPNSSYLTNNAKGDIEAFSYRVISKDIGGIIVMGHTDSYGSDTYNQWMSARRAERVAKYLKSVGLPEDRMMVYGFGETKPLATNKTAVGRSKNRRVEVFVFGPGRQPELPRRFLIDMNKGVSATPPPGSVTKRKRAAAPKAKAKAAPKTTAPAATSSQSVRCGFGNRSADCSSGQKFKL